MAKKEIEAIDADLALDTDHAEPRVYELGFHIDPELSTDEIKKTYEGVRALIEKSGTIVAEGEPKKVQLAYTVSRTEAGTRRDFDASAFAWIAYEANGEGHDAVATAAREENRIFRFLDVRTTKEEAQHFAEMQEMMANMPDGEEGEEETVSETELDAALKEVA